MNTIKLNGRLVADLKVINEKFSVGTIIRDNGYYKGEGESKEWVSCLESFSVKFSGPVNGQVQSELKKGTKFELSGKLRQEVYVNKEGQTIYSTYIQAYSISGVEQPKEVASVEVSDSITEAGDSPF